ncbi:MAG: hypothetical protein VXZ82_00465 [Planctomycetota bacterium]|nr:hypothetical protein [Planctomycetota bacterium]
MDICKDDLSDSLRRGKAAIRLSEQVAIAENGFTLTKSQIAEFGRLAFKHLCETAKRSAFRHRLSVERFRTEEFAKRAENFVTDENIDSLCFILRGVQGRHSRVITRSGRHRRCSRDRSVGSQYGHTKNQRVLHSNNVEDRISQDRI